MSKKRFFVVVSHCLLNPSTRVHVLGRRFEVAEKICGFFLSKKVSIIQLPCPEFTAMGYLRNPQGRQQYDNIFFRKHCRKELESYVDMICELINNHNTPLGFIGIQGSPNCSIHWGKHKMNKYKTESIMPESEGVEEDGETGSFGVMTEVFNDMLLERGIKLDFLEAPVKEALDSERAKVFFKEMEGWMYLERNK
ncbi:MAG: hypothetical protein ACRC2K_09705 [Clostridium sp.]